MYRFSRSLIIHRNYRIFSTFSNTSSSLTDSLSSSSTSSSSVITLHTPSTLRSATLALYKSQLKLSQIFDKIIEDNTTTTNTNSNTTDTIGYSYLKLGLTLPGIQTFSKNDNNIPHIQRLRKQIQIYRDQLLTSSSSTIDTNNSSSPSSTIVYQPGHNITQCIRTIYRNERKKLHQLAQTNQTNIETILHQKTKDIEILLDSGFNLLREYSQLYQINTEILQNKESTLPLLNILPNHENIITTNSTNTTIVSHDDTPSSSTETITIPSSIPSSSLSSTSSSSSVTISKITEANALSPGIVLMDHPAIGNPGRSLILVYDVSQNIKDIHNNEDWMIRGYIINRPFPHKVQDMIKLSSSNNTNKESDIDSSIHLFGELPIFHGGLEGNNQLSILHSIPDLENSVPINSDNPHCSALYIGGRVDNIIQRLKNKSIQPEQIKVLSGIWESKLVVTGTQINPTTGMNEPILAWPEADLYLQVEGTLASDIALLPPLFHTMTKYIDSKGLQENIDGYNYARFWHQNLTYNTLLYTYGQALYEQAKQEIAKLEFILTNKQRTSDNNLSPEEIYEQLQYWQTKFNHSKEIRTWYKLHAAVIGYARALAPQSPVSYLELYTNAMNQSSTTERNEK